MTPVTSENYIRAESDRSFSNVAALGGGINHFYFIRKPTPLDKQTVIRMNRDTLYSGAVVDTSKGATVTLPRVDGNRFVSAQVVDNDHYCPAVFYEPGRHAIASDTKYALVIVRTQLFDPNDAAEVAQVNALQDQLRVEAGSADPLPPLEWDPESLKSLTAKYEAEAKGLASFKGLWDRGELSTKPNAISPQPPPGASTPTATRPISTTRATMIRGDAGARPSRFRRITPSGRSRSMAPTAT